MLHVTIVHFDIGLCEETENLCHQILLGGRDILFPVAHVFGQRHFFGNPVDALLRQPCLVTPRIQERFINVALFE